MTRAALRKAQHNLFDVGVAAAFKPRAEARRAVGGPFVHPCQAAGCGAWGERGFPGGRWFCFERRAMGEAA